MLGSDAAICRRGRLRASPVVFGLIILGVASAAVTGEYPERPIRFLVPSAPGGTPDIISRAFASELSRQMGQQVVVDNRPGAGGAIGMHMLAKAAPDGHSIGYAPISAIAINPGLLKLPYDTEKDFQPVVQLVFGVGILTVTPSLPIRSVRELIDYAKKNPGKLSYASGGSGTTGHVGMELFKLMTGTEMVHVPFKAIQPAITEVIAGRLHVVVDNLASMGPHVKVGRVRALAVTSPNRSRAFPELPTVSEAGLPGFEVTTWSGVIVPAGVSKSIVARLNSEINMAIGSQAIKDSIWYAGYELVGGTPEQFAALIRKETVKWAEVIRRTGAKVD